MKTININLIGDLGKIQPKVKKQPIRSNEDVNPKTRVLSVIFVSAACIVFITSFLVWMFVMHESKKTETSLAELKLKHEKVKDELQKSISNHKNLQKEKSILSIKLLAKNQIDDLWLPWQKILIDIAATVPKDIKVTQMAKATSRIVTSDKKEYQINVGGKIFANRVDPIKSISFFLLNINENPSAALSLYEATVKEFKYDESSKLYDFMINTKVKLPEKKPVIKKDK